MRKSILHIFIVALVAATTFVVGCSKDETKSFDVPSKGIIISKLGGEGTTSFDSRNITSIIPSSIPKGWEIVNIDMYSSTITVKAPKSFDDGEVENGTLDLKGFTPTGNTVTKSIYVAYVPREVTFSDAANCYVVTKADTRYFFNPMIGGSSTSLATERVELLWETRKDLVKYLDMRDGVVSFYVSSSADDETKVDTGNALIGAYDASGELIWSWHIWVTNNDPVADENVIELGGRSVMNINLGAYCNSNASTDGATIYDSYGLYYQWGRKDPFVGPQRYNFPGNFDASLYNKKGFNCNLDYQASTSETGSVAWATSHPMAIILGDKDNGYDWLCGGHDDALWGDAKTESDPCPAGWRVADASVFENLTIATAYDDMPWREAQHLYGWMLTDTTTGVEHFFTAQGRRNYLDGRLDIVNDDEMRPVPWSGYYWTTTLAEKDADATALFFDLNSATRTWNGFDAKCAMHRANALPVRCVKK